MRERVDQRVREKDLKSNLKDKSTDGLIEREGGYTKRMEWAL